jgi:hypothetical protein
MSMDDARGAVAQLPLDTALPCATVSVVPPQEAWLRRVFDGWDPARQGAWEERAAVREYEGGWPRCQAELLGFHDLTR